MTANALLTITTTLAAPFASAGRMDRPRRRGCVARGAARTGTGDAGFAAVFRSPTLAGVRDRALCSQLKQGAGLPRITDAYAAHMKAHGLNPILNVSDLVASIRWFERLGWEKAWEWGDPPSFGAVRSGACEVFLCQDGQGGRGHGGVPMTFGPDGDQSADRGVWMSVWVDDVDALHEHCRAAGIEVAWPPADMPWGVREMHVRHPDGHVFRFSHPVHSDDHDHHPHSHEHNHPQSTTG